MAADTAKYSTYLHGLQVRSRTSRSSPTRWAIRRRPPAAGDRAEGRLRQTGAPRTDPNRRPVWQRPFVTHGRGRQSDIRLGEIWRKGAVRPRHPPSTMRDGQAPCASARIRQVGRGSPSSGWARNTTRSATAAPGLSRSARSRLGPAARGRPPRRRGGTGRIPAHADGSPPARNGRGLEVCRKRAAISTRLTRASTGSSGATRPRRPPSGGWRAGSSVSSCPRLGWSGRIRPWGPGCCSRSSPSLPPERTAATHPGLHLRQPEPSSRRSRERAEMSPAPPRQFSLPETTRGAR